MLQIISILMENKPGALMRVTGLFAQRNYNIESLTVARTLDPALSRMTIVADVDPKIRPQVIKQINLPILALGGSRDPMMQGAFLIEFAQAAGPKAKYVFYGGPGGAPHSFEGFEARVTDDIVTWIDQRF